MAVDIIDKIWETSKWQEVEKQRNQRAWTFREMLIKRSKNNDTN